MCITSRIRLSGSTALLEGVLCEIVLEENPPLNRRVQIGRRPRLARRTLETSGSKNEEMSFRQRASQPKAALQA